MQPVRFGALHKIDLTFIPDTYRAGFRTALTQAFPKGVSKRQYIIGDKNVDSPVFVNHLLRGGVESITIATGDDREAPAEKTAQVDDVIRDKIITILKGKLIELIGVLRKDDEKLPKDPKPQINAEGFDEAPRRRKVVENYEGYDEERLRAMYRINTLGNSGQFETNSGKKVEQHTLNHHIGDYFDRLQKWETAVLASQAAETEFTDEPPQVDLKKFPGVMIVHEMRKLLPNQKQALSAQGDKLIINMQDGNYLMEALGNRFKNLPAS